MRLKRKKGRYESNIKNLGPCYHSSAACGVEPVSDRRVERLSNIPSALCTTLTVRSTARPTGLA